MDKILMTAGNTKYTDALADSGNAAMLLYGVIGEDVNGKDFAHEMLAHKARGKNITVKINSPGGDVINHGYPIIQAVVDTEADTHIVGMAASMAGIIAQFGKVRTANDFATGMVHAPKGKDSSLVSIIKNQLINILANRSKLRKSEIESMMSEGKETWMDASDMLNRGMIDKIVYTGKSKPNVNAFAPGDYNNVYAVYCGLLDDYELLAKRNPQELLRIMQHEPQRFERLSREYIEGKKVVNNNKTTMNMAKGDGIKNQGFHTNPERINKNGRPPKLPTIEEALEKCYGDEEKINKVLMALYKKAEKGDVRAIELILDRCYGKVKQPVDVTSHVIEIIDPGPAPTD